MAETLGEGLALQSSFKPTTEPILTKSLLRADEMDMKKALQKQKQEEARLKREKDIYGRIKTFDAKLNPYYQSKAKQDYANYISQSLEAARNQDMDAAVQLEQDFKMRAQAYKQQSDAMDNFVKLGQQGFLVPQEISRIRELPHEQADAELKKLLQERPEFSTIVNVGDNGEIMFNPIKNVDVNKYLTDVLENNKELATEQVGSKMLDKNTREFIKRIPKDKIALIAQDLALDPNVQGNLIFKDRKAYDAIYDKIEAANPNINPQDAKLMAMKELVQTKLEGLNRRAERSDVPTGKGGFAINFGNGGATIGRNQFNYTLADPSQSLGAYQKAGIIDENYIKTLKTQSPEQQQAAADRVRTNVGDLLSISGPNKGGYSLIDDKGKKVYLDNIDFVYVPKTVGGKGGQWMVKGVSRTGTDSSATEKIEYIPITEKTYGNVISIYPELTKDQLVEMFNDRMRQGGIKNDKFVLNLAGRKGVPTTTTQPPKTKTSLKNVPKGGFN